MTDVTTGSLLANRYRLLSRAESDLADVEAWLATDQILDRSVQVAIVSGSHAPAALDEARRAALVSDPRISRVIDAGLVGDVRYVVLEQPAGDDLSILTSARPLQPDQARAIVGEAAAALEAAHRRGVYHLALRPHAVRVHQGRVQITGLGIDGTLNPGARGDAPTSARAEVVGLVSLLFYALTGKWPATNLGAVNASEGALLPEVVTLTDGKPPSLNDEAPEVPQDLVELVDQTLRSRSDGPRTPGELVSALEPWGPVTATPPRLFDSVQDFSLEKSSQEPVPAHPSESPSDSDDSEASAARVLAAAEPALPPFGQNVPAAVVRPIVRQSVRSTLSSGEKRQVRPGTPPPAAPTVEPGRVARKSVLSGASASAPSPATASSPPTPAPRPSPGPARVSPAPTPAARPTAAPWAAVSSEQPHSQATGSSPMKFDELVSAPREYRRFRFNPTALTLVLALVAVVIGVPYAFKGLAPALTNPFETKEIERPLPPGETPTDEESSPAASTKPAVTPVVASGEQLDPQGDNNEHPEAVHLAYDQDPSTFWFTRTYQSATFAGMGKDGIGFAVKLEKKAPVSTVYLSTNNTGGKVEVRATDPKTPTKGKVLASGPMTDELALELSETVDTEYIVLWFTELPQTPDGKNRVELREITLT